MSGVGGIDEDDSMGQADERLGKWGDFGRLAAKSKALAGLTERRLVGEWAGFEADAGRFSSCFAPLEGRSLELRSPRRLGLETPMPASLRRSTLDPWRSTCHADTRAARVKYTLAPSVTQQEGERALVPC